MNVEEKLLSTTAFYIKNNCAKSVGLVDVMRDVVKIVNNIRSKALSHRQFKALMDAQYGDVLYHQEVRWLSRGKVLRRFFDLRDEIRGFQESKDGNIQVPTDKKWLSDLAFLVDVKSNQITFIVTSPQHKCLGE